MILSFFSSRGWESWDVEHRPLIPEGMPVLVDNDLCFEDGPAAPRPTAVVNRWLRELPAGGAPAPSSWENYARALKEWMEFLAEHGVGLFDSRVRLKAGLSRYAEHRAAGPLKARFAATTWGQHMSILSLFYRWAINERYATAEPFTYRAARALFAGTGREVKVNLAVRRRPKPHVTIKYLEPDFTELFRKGLRGLAPDGSQDTGFHGRELTRNAAVGDHALATGMRLQEFTYLLAWHIARRPGGLISLAIQYGHMRTVLDARTSSGYGTRGRRGIHAILDVETALAAADTAARLRERAAAGEKISGPAARRALTAAAHTPRFVGRLVPRTFAKKASAFLARDGIVLYDNPDAFLICAFKHDNALCEPEPGATAPRQYDCRPGCGNTVRTDTHARLLRERADEIDQLADHAPQPIGQRLRTNANRLRTTADTHDATAQPAGALT